jgi:hypothetical protein
VLDPTVGPETLVDGAVRTVNLVTRTDFPPTAAFVGSSYALAVQGGNILLARARPDGTTPDPGATWVDHYADDVARAGLFPSIVSDGAGGALVVWSTAGGLWAARLDPAGTLSPPTLVDNNTLFGLFAESRYFYDFTPDADHLVSVIAVLGREMPPYAVRGHRLDGTYATAAPLATLGGALGPIYRPKIAAAASGYLVAWQTASVATGSDVRFTRVSRAGEVLDPAGAALTVAAANRHDVRLASDGTHWLASWTADTGSGSRAPGVYWVLLGADGAPVGAAVNYAGAGTTSGVAFNGANFLLAWRDGAAVNSARISPAGARLDATAARWDMVRDGDVNVSTNGSDFLVTSNIGGIVARAVSAANVPLGAIFTAARYNLDDTLGSLCYDGSQYRAVWARYDQGVSVSELLTARVTRAGALLDATPRTFPLPVDRPTWRNVGMTCTGTSLQHGDDLFATFGPSGDVTTERNLPSAFNRSSDAPFVFGVTAAPYGALAAGMVFATSDAYSVVAVRRGPDGAALDAFPIALGTVPSSDRNSLGKGAVAFDGTNHAVLWAAGDGSGSPLRLARVSPEGDVLDPGGRALAPPGLNASSATSVALAGGSAQHLLVWSNLAPCAAQTGSCQQLRAVRLSTAGAPLDASAIVLTGQLPSTNVFHRTVWDGREYLVVWSTPAPNGQVRAARISLAGALLDPVGGFAVTSSPGTKDSPVVASAGDGTAVVAYREYVPALGAMRYFTRTVAPDGVPVDAGVDAGAHVDVPRDLGAPADVGVTLDLGAPTADAGVDVVVVDAGGPPADLPAADTGETDAGSPPTDALAADVASGDAGSPATDAPAIDVGARDAGPPATDLGGARDVAPADTPAADTPAADAGPTDTGGASCAASPRAPARGASSLAFAAIAAALVRRRRRGARLPA